METTYNAKTNEKDINISSGYGKAGLAHELTPASQYDKGLLILKIFFLTCNQKL